jgi:hypothetical protein
MNKIKKNIKFMPILQRTSKCNQRNIKKGNKKSQRFENSSHSTSSSNSTSSFSINIDYYSCAYARSKGLEHPTLRS